MAPIESRLFSLVDSQRLPHGLALVGGDSQERRNLALQLARKLLCESGRACGHCGPCARITSGSSEAVLLVEPEGQQIKLEQAKAVLDFLSLRKISKAQLVILDPVHLLNTQAANALLKIVEEPPAGVYFVALCPSVSLLLPTFRSRLQTFRLPFLRERPEDMAEGEWQATLHKAFQGLPRRDRGSWSELVDYAKDKEAALAIAQNLQRLARQSLIASGTAPDPQMLEWWRRFFQLEMDILANLDRTLLFENFYFQAHS